MHVYLNKSRHLLLPSTVFPTTGLCRDYSDSLGYTNEIPENMGTRKWKDHGDVCVYGGRMKQIHRLTSS